jgi:hypothetical protein
MSDSKTWNVGLISAANRKRLSFYRISAPGPAHAARICIADLQPVGFQLKGRGGIRFWKRLPTTERANQFHFGASEGLWDSRATLRDTGRLA